MARQKSQEKQALKGQDPCVSMYIETVVGVTGFGNFVWPARE